MTDVEPGFDLDDLVKADRVAALADLPPRSERWRQARQEGLGGSEAASACGLGEFKSAFEVWLIKTGRHPDGLDNVSNEAADWGVLLEDVVATVAEKRTGLIFSKPKYLYRHRDPALGFMLANPDSLVYDQKSDSVGVYEGKTASVYMADRWGDEPNEPATYALMQSVHYMEVLDVDFAVIAVLIGGQQFHKYRVERDRELAEMMIAREVDLWDHVQRNEMPPPSGLEADKDLLNRLWDPVVEKKIILGDDAAELARTYKQNKAVIKKAQWDADVAANELRALMEDATMALTGDGKLIATWRPYETTVFNQKQLEADMPRFAETYKRKETRRPMVPKEL